MNENIKLSTGRVIREKGRASDVPVPSFSSGLSENEVALSREKYGRNTITPKKRAGFFTQFIKNLNDPIIKILIGALVINTALTFSDMNWAETIGIALTVLISALVSTISEHSSGAAFEKLYSTLGDGKCKVIRGGKETECMTSELVRYDIVYLHPGDTVPADGILVSGSVSCDESALTGESKKVTKSYDRALLHNFVSDPSRAPKPEDSCAVLRGSHVSGGSAVMLVTSVGDSTLYGKVASELSVENSESPLKNRLSALAKTISKIGYVSAAIIAVVHLVDAFWIESGMNVSVMLSRLHDVHFVVRELISALTMAISIVVVAVPEGLPMMITVVLSSNMKKMMRSGVLVRRLVGIETAGGVDILFTDKTGTLTTGKLSVIRAVTAEGEAGSNRDLPSPIRNILREAASACASVSNSTERAVNTFIGAKKLTLPDSAKIPFDSSRKFSAAMLGDRTYVHGAAEYLLPLCTSYLSSNGRDVPMSEDTRQHITETIKLYSENSCRVLLAAYGGDILQKLKAAPMKGDTPLTFAALYILRDEIRREAAPAVRECHSAGIRVVMLTGDNAGTAASIARECEILPDIYEVYKKDCEHRSGVPLVIDGQMLPHISDDELSCILDDVRVISRVTPSDKSRLIRIAKAAGHITGMTGDGINDAPALRISDVGFAMGSGTDVAREAGDIVITDDNFASITKAVLFGRTIFDSICKFITFQLTMNMAAVGVSVIGTMFGIEHPVTVIQMLWVNIIMDTLGSLAFAGEPPLSDIMHRPPVKRDAHILSGKMAWQIILTGAYAILVSMYFLTSSSVRHFFGGGINHLTAFFAMFIFIGIGIALCARTSHINPFANIRKNRAFLIIMPAVAAIQLLIVYFGGEVFRCVPLESRSLLYCGLIATTVIFADTVRKCLVKILHPHDKK